MVTPELAASPMLLLMANGKLPEVGSLLFNHDDRRLVLCASESPEIPAEALPAEYDTWIQIEAKPAIALIHDTLVKRVPDVEGPVFKKVIYDPTIDGHDNFPPLRAFPNSSTMTLDFTTSGSRSAQGSVRKARFELVGSPIREFAAILSSHWRSLDSETWSRSSASEHLSDLTSVRRDQMQVDTVNSLGNVSCSCIVESVGKYNAERHAVAV